MVSVVSVTLSLRKTHGINLSSCESDSRPLDTRTNHLSFYCVVMRFLPVLTWPDVTIQLRRSEVLASRVSKGDNQGVGKRKSTGKEEVHSSILTLAPTLNRCLPLKSC